MFKRKKTITNLKLELKKKKIKEVLELMLDSDSEVHYAPITKEYFIIDKKNELNICLSEDSVKISNHMFLYEVSFSLELATKYMNIAKQKVEDRAMKIKGNLFKNQVELLNNLKKLYEKEN